MAGSRHDRRRLSDLAGMISNSYCRAGLRWPWRTFLAGVCGYALARLRGVVGILGGVFLAGVADKCRLGCFDLLAWWCWRRRADLVRGVLLALHGWLLWMRLPDRVHWRGVHGSRFTWPPPP